MEVSTSTGIFSGNCLIYMAMTAMTQKAGMDRYAVIWTYTYGTKEYSYANDLK